MEMSCLTSVDEDDKDADSKINPLTLLQEPMRMAQESTSCTDSFVKASLKQNSVLDVLSSSDMLSPVGLANGPSLHQATQAHELNSISSEKEEEKSITPLKTVQELDTAGIWGFDVESPENSLDNFDSASDLNWDPHREFMQFLWENHSDSPGEEPKEEVGPGKSQRTRKRKMDMVVMVDPSENLCPDLSSTSSEGSSDAEAQVGSNPVRKGRNAPKLPKPTSSPTGNASKYPNGTAKAIKEILYKAPARNSHDNSVSHGISPLKGRLTINSHSEVKPASFPCPKCNLLFKKEHRLIRHMKSHADLPTISTKPFTCRECGQSFKQSRELIDHMSVHQEKKTRLSEEIKVKKPNKNAKFFCPQCPFGTDCPNTFVQHAKTHEKDKRKFRCDKCSFRTLSENDLRRHNIMQHTVITVKKQIQSNANETFPCNICSYKAFGKHVFENHLMRRHQLTFEEYMAAEQSETDGQPSQFKVPTFKAPVEHTEFTSKISIKDQISSRRAGSPNEPSDISDLFKNSKFKKGPKSQLPESKLDKSINVLLSRQNHGKKASEQKRESNNYSPHDQGSRSGKDNYDGVPKMFSVKLEDSKNGGELFANHSSFRKTPSKRKMSTPYRNTSEQDSCFILPKPLPGPKKVNLEEEVSDCDEKDIFQVNNSDGNSLLCDDGIKKEKKHIFYTYSRRMSIRGALQASKRLFEKIKNEEQEQNDPEIKEECIETEVFQETFESHQIPLGESLTDDLSELESGHKNCPYCPAVFESGVGLSNHIRGHLHRVGLSYNARHVVPPEQVASQDRRPRIRRKISAFRRLRKALQAETETATETVKGVHSCPLCGDSFDNRTGQSNHIRGHLKKLGKSCPTKNKSPLLLLRELMRDKRECQRALQILGRRRNHFYYSSSSKLTTANRFAPSQTGFPKSNSVPSIYGDAKPLMPTFSLAEVHSDKGQLESKPDVKNSLTGNNALIGILKKRKCQDEARVKGPSQVARNVLTISANSENSSGSRVASSLPNSGSEKGEFNRKVCIHCNATFHSGVSLSNHLRAYANRKRIALLEGTTIGCKAVRQRSRPGSKKKTLPLPQTPEEMYRLTCRFCDLVFQGPLSVQEDWIKHLQRHIMNTGVPHTGLGMVEVAPLPTDPPSLQTDQDLPVTHAAS
ncbi:zinc finger protein 644a [Cololabis saira]|uniref:zinc finger protein 644a n=1 Tax=Cololabis saira TaxID=129043 RepID=UPI002AD557D8|nr:zinc finger protein 644a [Cololabis saira]